MTAGDCKWQRRFTLMPGFGRASRGGVGYFVLVLNKIRNSSMRGWRFPRQDRRSSRASTLAWSVLDKIRLVGVRSDGISRPESVDEGAIRAPAAGDRSKRYQCPGFLRERRIKAFRDAGQETSATAKIASASVTKRAVVNMTKATLIGSINISILSFIQATVDRLRCVRIPSYHAFPADS